jgi:zona occludens toxin (predicted ATPase)
VPHIIHLTQAQYADVLNMRYEAEKGGRLNVAGFEFWMVREHNAQPFVENQIHVVKLINRSGKNVAEQYRRYWKWCPRCERLIGLEHWDTWGRESEIAQLSEQLKSSAAPRAVTGEK